MSSSTMVHTYLPLSSHQPLMSDPVSGTSQRLPAHVGITVDPWILVRVELGTRGGFLFHSHGTAFPTDRFSKRT